MKPNPLPPGVYRNVHGKLSKLCRGCGKEKTFSTVKIIKVAIKKSDLCRDCANKKYNKRRKKFYNKIRLSWFVRCKGNARNRKINWDLTVEYIWDLYVAQGERCSLSGKKIDWAYVGINHSASIDRIDSKIGYVQGNVQLVHKDLNMMKQSFSQKKFIELCEMVVRYQKSLHLGL